MRVQQLGISQNQLGRRLHATSSSMSKYVSGERVPDWEFVEALLQAVHKITKQALDAASYEELRELHERALFLRHPQRHDVQRIAMALDTSELQIAEMKLREAELEQEVQRLQERLDALRADQGREREQHEAEQAKLRRELEDTGARIEQMQRQCTILEEQLGQAQERAATAERTESAEALVPASEQDDREFGPDQVTLLETLADTYAQALTEEARAEVYQQLKRLPWYAGAAALALLDRRYPHLDSRAFAAAAMGGRSEPVEVRDAITWFYRHVPLTAADRLTRRVALGLSPFILAKVMESLARTRGAEAALAAVAEAAFNVGNGIGRSLQFTPSSMFPVVARSISDATLFREVHAREQRLREADRHSLSSARQSLETMLQVLTAGSPASTAARILWLNPRLQDMAMERATKGSDPESLKQLAAVAVQLRRLQAEQGVGDRDLASHLLGNMLAQTNDPVAVANLLSLWESEAEQKSEGVTVGDRLLALSMILKRHTSDAVRQLVTHNVALPPGSTHFFWRPDRFEPWQHAVDQLPVLQRRKLTPMLRSITRSAPALRQDRATPEA
ncbi:hypothetical protein M4V62_43450 (plasmid) [Streptomyces durmitorensis]|uniref:HTH cro/C1-type domain-containing protein n=2 Tax=Streptomyces durmitorensis TaxID=319947 RepID=A0ABY4QA41_9ACTN|nr:helix-turn-helix transcriptional regulator [Streptomyces durmitorensis]UQT61989.1 hypothetical protein M4V62_43450 [Streptomyces durmitorensis]